MTELELAIRKLQRRMYKTQPQLEAILDELTEAWAAEKKARKPVKCKPAKKAEPIAEV